MTLERFDERVPYNDPEDIDNGWGGSPITITPADNPGFRIDSMVVSTTETVDNTMVVWFTHNGSGSAILGTVPIPAGAGTDPLVPAVDLIPVVFPTLLSFCGKFSDGLGVVPGTPVVSGKHMYLTTIGGFF